MINLKNMKQIAIALVFGVLSQQVLAQETDLLIVVPGSSSGGGGSSNNEVAANRSRGGLDIDFMTSTLGLSADQKTQVQKILDTTKVESLIGPDGKQVDRRIAKQMAIDKSLEKVLSKAQWEKYQEIAEANKNKKENERQ